MVKSPCISACILNEGVCQGCGRTAEEIGQWSSMSDEQKLQVLERIGENNENR